MDPIILILRIFIIIVVILLGINFARINQIYAPNNVSEFMTVKSPSQDRLVLYYADWCGICQQFKPIWKDFLEKVKPSQLVQEIDCEKNKDICIKNNIPGFPSIVLHKSNGTTKFYTGPRTIQGLTEFIKN